MQKAKRDEFELIEPLKVRHLPTGFEFSTYRYDNPDDVRIAVERIGTEGNYDVDSIREEALSLLRASAKAAKK